MYDNKLERLNNLKVRSNTSQLDPHLTPFCKKEGSDFSHKKGGVSKMGGCLKGGEQGVSLFILTNPFQHYLSMEIQYRGSS